MDLNYLINKAVKFYGDYEGEAIANALYSLFKKDIKKAKDALNKEIWHNVYTEITNYYDLSIALVNEEALWEEEDSKPLYNFLEKEEREEVLKNRLFEAGWVIIEEYEVAFLLPDEVLIATGIKSDERFELSPI